ncbi:MAG: hypothetical protein ACYS0D_16540 [Planctomycetota bacterium]|jgi:hypothetical protein
MTKQLMIETGRDEVTPLSEIQVPDLWHLAAAVAKTGACLKTAREEEIVSSHHAEDVLETLLNDALLQEGEGPRQSILDVWHLASSTTRALLRIKASLNEALRLLDLPMAEGDVLVPRLREVLTGALEGKEVVL